jgi:hypothetical protein
MDDTTVDIPLGLEALDRGSIRVCIVTGMVAGFELTAENFLPKIDGVTRTLARLLDHLREKGHEALIVGPDNGLVISHRRRSDPDFLCRFLSSWHTWCSSVLLSRVEMEFPLPIDIATNHRFQTGCNSFRRSHSSWSTSSFCSKIVPSSYPKIIVLSHKYRTLRQTFRISNSKSCDMEATTICTSSVRRDYVS